MDRWGFIDFLKKLHKDIGKPLIVIVDRASYHRANEVKDYVRETAEEVTLEYLPTRSPELNPSEQVWNRAKHRLGRMIIRNKADMKRLLLRVLRRIQQRAGMVETFFELKDTRYALLALAA